MRDAGVGFAARGTVQPFGRVASEFPPPPPLPPSEAACMLSAAPSFATDAIGG